MTDLVLFVLIFLAAGLAVLGGSLLLGKLVRPHQPNPEKGAVYECGEPTIGSAWIQFDLRFYVVALLFVIFDVEVAFFFPWAVVFGQANALSRDPAHANVVQVNTAKRELLGQHEAYEPTLADRQMAGRLAVVAF